TGQGVVAGDLDQSLGPDPPPDIVAFLGGSLVVPQEGGPYHLATVVEQHRAVHLARQTDGFDVGRVDFGLADQGPHRLDGGGPPQGGILLGPERAWVGVVVGGHRHPRHGPGGVDQDRLGGGGGDVDADHIGHSPSLSSVTSRATSRWGHSCASHLSRCRATSPCSITSSGPSVSSSQKASLT